MTGVWVVLTVLFVVVGLVAFTAGRATRQLEREHEQTLSRWLHPTGERSVIDQPPGEQVRRIGPGPYDWNRAGDDDEG